MLLAFMVTTVASAQNVTVSINTKNIIPETVAKETSTILTSRFNRNQDASIHPKKIISDLEITLLKFGYRQIQANVKINRNKIHITINDARPIYISEISIQPTNLPANSESLIYSSFIVSNIFDQFAYEKFKTEILSKLSSSGYVSASFNENNRVEIDEDNKAYVYINLDLGPKYTIKSIDLKSKHFDNNFLCKIEQCLPENLEYNSDTISEIHNMLNQTRLFKGVDIEVNPDQIDHVSRSIPIVANLKPLPENRYIGKFGYSSNEGFIGAASWAHRRTSNPGHIFQARVQASSKKYALNFNYKLPGNCPITQAYLLELGHKQTIPNETITRQTDLTASYIDRSGYFEKTLSLNIFLERFQLTDTAKKQRAHYLIPKAIFKKNYYGTEFKGQFEIIMLASVNFLFSTSRLFQFNINNSHIHELTNSFSLHLKTLIASTIFKNNHYATPPSLRFFAGGDSSVRGYSYNSLGPALLSDSGKLIVIGGDKKIELSSELQYAINDKFGLAGFLDAGNAMDQWQSLAVGAGVGIRYNLDIGQFKFDIAKPLSSKYGDKKVRLHLSFVSSF
ncbi:MAG: BamA/TamA family outer membrane protein [Francisellaceae bacterium]|nr:BamA/TamA family outer membrane protein [Francisellaceae bacterium]